MPTRHETFTFLAFAGRNVQKRVDILLSAAKRLVEEGIDIKIILVDGQKLTVADTMFEKKPEWLTELVPQEDINQVFALADCFVSTSVHETFSYAIAEATVFGLPVIQSDIEGTMWNSANPSAFLFPSGNVDALSAEMKRVISTDADEMRHLCAESRMNIIRNYSLDSWSQKVVDFFKSIP